MVVKKSKKTKVSKRKTEERKLSSKKKRQLDNALKKLVKNQGRNNEILDI